MELDYWLRNSNRGDLITAHVFCGLYWMMLSQRLFCWDVGRLRTVSSMYFLWAWLPAYIVLIAALCWADLPLVVTSGVPCLYHAFQVITNDFIPARHDFQKRRHRAASTMLYQSMYAENHHFAGSDICKEKTSSKNTSNPDTSSNNGNENHTNRLRSEDSSSLSHNAASKSPILDKADDDDDEGGSVVRSARPLRVFSSNLLMVNRNNKGIIDELFEFDPDVVLLQEYSPRWDHAMAQRGIDERYPFHIKLVREDSFGTAIYSRLPFIESEIVEIADIPFAKAMIDINQTDDDDNDSEHPEWMERVPCEVVFLSVHPLPPRLDYTPIFNYQIGEIISVCRNEKESHPQRGVVMSGDWNISQHCKHHASICSIPSVQSCHRLVGRGFAISFPNGIFPVPPIRLDHVFITTDVLQCVSMKEGKGHGSDHLPLMYELKYIPL